MQETLRSKKGAVTGSQFIDESLVGYWQFSGNANDSSIWGNHGTLQGGATATKGVVELDGTTGKYVSIGDKNSLDFSATDSFTYLMWVYATGHTTNWDMCWSKGGASGPQPGYDMELGQYDWAAHISDGNPNHFKTRIFGVEENFLNRWVLLTAVVNRSSAQFRVYVDASEVGSPTDITGFGSVANEYSATIGAYFDQNYPFKGFIDEVMVFKRALEPWEIRQLYENSNKRYGYYDELRGGTLNLSGRASIRWNGTDLLLDSGTGKGYFSGRVSATGYDTRTSVYDKSKGPALSFIQDADYYLTNGKVDHSKFYGYTTYDIPHWRDEAVTVYRKYIGDGPEDYIYQDEPPTDMRGWQTVKYTRKVFDTQTEKAVSLNAEIDVLRQALFELKQENQTLKAELVALKAAIGVK